MTRRSLLSGSAVLLVWAVTMGVLVTTYYSNRETVLENPPASFFGSVQVAPKWQRIEEYMLVLHVEPESNTRSVVGAASTVIDVDRGSTSTYRADFHLEGKLSPLLPKAVISAAGLLDRNVNLTSFHGDARLGPIHLAATGEASNDILYVKAVNSNNTSFLKKKLSGPISMAEVVRPALSRRMDIRPGAKMSTQILDPLTGQSRGTLTIEIVQKETIQIADKEVEALKVVSSIGDLETVMWVDDAGRTLRRNLVANLIMERTTREKAVSVAPSLDDSVSIPELDLSHFDSVPLQENTPQAGTKPSHFSLLESLLR